MKTSRSFSLIVSEPPPKRIQDSEEAPHWFFTSCLRGDEHRRFAYGLNLPYGHQNLRAPYSKSTPLHMLVVGSEDVTKIKDLIKNGANVNQANMYGGTPLHYAAQKGNPNVVRLLLDKRADPTCADNDGEIPLHWAASGSHENEQVIGMLLGNRNSLVDRVNCDGFTPIMLAIGSGNIETVKFLLDKGALLGNSLEIASECQEYDIVNVLMNFDH